MYSAAIYNYFNNGRYTRKQKCRKRRIPIPKPAKTKQMNTCMSCGRNFFKTPPKSEDDAATVNQPGNIVYEKVLLIWKYAKSFLSKTVRRHDHQKCSFKIIAHKSYKKRSLQKEIFTTSASVSPQLCCKMCDQRKTEKTKCVRTAEQKINEKVLHEFKNKTKKGKKHEKDNLLRKEISDEETTETTETVQSHEYLRGKKRRIKLCTRSSRSSFQKKKSKYNCGKNITNIIAFKKNASKKNTEKKNVRQKKPLLPKRKFNTIKKKRMFLKENRKKMNRFASWQYIQHALNSVKDDDPPSSINEDKTPVYLTFEEYCLILESIDTQGNAAERFRNTSGDLATNVEEAENTDTYTRRSTTTIEDIGTNTDQTVVNTEDASTNTEQIWVYTEELVVNTEQIVDTTEELYIVEEVTKNTEPVSISEFIEDTEETNEINEELNENSEHLSENTETLDAVNDILSEAIEEFEANINEPSDTILNIEINKANEEVSTNSSKDNEKINSSQNSSEPNNTNEETSNNDVPKESNNINNNRNLIKNIVPNNSFVDINQINQTQSTIDPVQLCEQIERIRTLNGTEQTQKNYKDQTESFLNQQEETTGNTFTEN